jgi:hypothetical protein
MKGTWTMAKKNDTPVVTNATATNETAESLRAKLDELKEQAKAAKEAEKKAKEEAKAAEAEKKAETDALRDEIKKELEAKDSEIAAAKEALDALKTERTEIVKKLPKGTSGTGSKPATRIGPRRPLQLSQARILRALKGKKSGMTLAALVEEDCLRADYVNEMIGSRKGKESWDKTQEIRGYPCLLALDAVNVKEVSIGEGDKTDRVFTINDKGRELLAAYEAAVKEESKE